MYGCGNAHVVLDDKYQVVQRLQLEAARQRHFEPDQPKTNLFPLIDCQLTAVLLL